MLNIMPSVEKIARTDSGLASALRISVMRLARRVRTERDPENELLPVGQLSVLGALKRLGDSTVGELADRRARPAAVDDPHVNCLDEGGYVVRRKHERDGRQVVVGLSEKGLATLAADRRRRDAWLAQRLRELTPDERAAAPAGRTASSKGLPSLEPHVPRPVEPQLPPVRRRWRRLEHRHLDAARRAGLAGHHAVPGHRRQRHRPRHHHRSAVPADPAVLGLRRPGRRPLPEAPDAPVHPGRDGSARHAARCPRDHRDCADLARLRARVRVRHRHRVRRTHPPVVRVGDGRA